MGSLAHSFDYRETAYNIRAGGTAKLTRGLGLMLQKMG